MSGAPNPDVKAIEAAIRHAGHSIDCRQEMLGGECDCGYGRARAGLSNLVVQLAALEDALQAIYWQGVHGEAEEWIIAVLSAERRAEWAKTHGIIRDREQGRDGPPTGAETSPAPEQTDGGVA